MSLVQDNYVDVNSASRKIWAVIERSTNEMDAATASLIEYALHLADSLSECRASVLAFVSDDDLVEGLVSDLENFGVSKINLVRCKDAVAGTGVDVCAGLIGQDGPDLVLFQSSFYGVDLAARVSARLNLPLISDCVRVSEPSDGVFNFGSLCAAGMAVVTTEVTDNMPVLAVVGTSKSVSHTATKTQAQVVETDISAYGEERGGDKLELISDVAISPEDITLSEASLIVSGGRGVGGPEGFDPLFDLAGLIGAHVGASRVATDLNWIDRQHLVGISGSTVRPAVYLACGISGDPHHLLGMSGSATIVAVNTDPKAPIFKIATHAFVGELAPVIAGVTERIRALKAGG